MKTRVKLGGQTKLRLNSKLAERFKINEGDIFDVDIKEDQILLTKQQQE